MKIKILYLIDTISCDTAGTQKQLLQTIKRLDNNRFEPYLVCLWESKWLRENKVPCRLKILGYEGFAKITFPKTISRLSKYIDDHRIDIVQTFFEDSIFVGYLAYIFSKNKPVLLSSRRDMGLGTGQPWYHSLFKIAKPLVNIKFDGILVNSRHLKDYVSKRELVRKEKIEIVRNGVMIPDVSSIEKENVFDYGHDAIIVGIVASLTKVKRIDLFLEALYYLKRNYPRLKIKGIVLGDGPEKKFLMNMCESKGLENTVAFKGAVKNVFEYIAHFDIGVLCSDREGLSNAILEYMSCKKPVIATNVGGNSELVNEANGICVAPGDAESIAKAILNLANDKRMRNSKGQKSYQKVIKLYSWESTMNKLENYYRKLVTNRQLRIEHTLKANNVR